MTSPAGTPSCASRRWQESPVASGRQSRVLTDSGSMQPPSSNGAVLQVPYDAQTWKSGPFSVTRSTSVRASPAASGPR